MRLFEVAGGDVRRPKSHAILAVVEVGEQAWHQFRGFVESRPELALLGRCRAPRGRLTVYVGCANNGVRQKLEERLTGTAP